nr:retrotransposon protein, putative, Ty1-copia subclass [Tanacetum cinerariifolium]
VWEQVKTLIGIPNMPSTLDLIVEFLISLAKKRSTRCIIAKLVFAASCYFIWKERNNRLFVKQKRSYDQITKVIQSNVRLKLLSCKFKKTKTVQILLNPGEVLDVVWKLYVHSWSKECQLRVVLLFTSPRSMFEREKLSGNNFNDWFRQLKLVLRVEKMYVIEQPLPVAPTADSVENVLAEWNAIYDAYNEVSCLILGSMTHELHRQFENSSPYDMIQELKSMFEKQAGVERHVSRQGASYFITFTDDYSRYGYVYLLKHKHKVFETFKVFKNKVENQLRKTIKALQLDQDGYPKEIMGYYFYFPSEKKIVVVRYADFFEKNLITQEVSGRAIDLEEIQDEDTSPFEITSEIPMEVEGFEPPQEEVIPICRSKRTHQAPNHLCLNVKVKEHSLGDLNKPASYKAAMLDSESKKWIDAMNAEIQSIGAWSIFFLAVRLLGVSFVDPNHLRKVCKLQRSIYGLKQASRSWNKRFEEEIKKFGFAQNLDEPCVYQKASGSNVTFFILYVDDIIIVGNRIPSLQSVKDYLGKCFAMKDLGEAAFILEIKIYRDRSKRLTELGQNAYMDKILKRYKMDNFKRGYIPMQERLDLNKTQVASTPKEVKRMQNVPYALVVGSIMYSARCTRPDVAFAQNITSRFQQNPVNATGLL